MRVHIKLASHMLGGLNEGPTIQRLTTSLGLRDMDQTIFVRHGIISADTDLAQEQVVAIIAGVPGVEGLTTDPSPPKLISGPTGVAVAPPPPPTNYSKCAISVEMVDILRVQFSYLEAANKRLSETFDAKPQNTNLLAEMRQNSAEMRELFRIIS